MDKTSESILALQPVTFRYKHELDPDAIPQFGLVAEDVEKVDPDLVVHDQDGKPFTVRYEAVNAMLLNEFLKEHRKVEVQQATIAELTAKLEAQENGSQARFSQQQKQIEALSATVQKVSDRLELNRRAPQLVTNDQ
jgi:ABC-type hemin transport system substrate-binding protein